MELPGRAEQPQRRAGDVDRLGDLERPDDEGHQVGGHRHRLGEAHPPLAVEDLVGHDRGVGHRVELVVEQERDGEAGLEVGLVPAREGPPGVGGLELGGGDHALGAVVVGEGGAVEAAELVVQQAPEPQRHHGVARRQLLGEGEGGALGVLVEADGGGQPAAAALDPGLIDLELDGVEHHRAAWPRRRRRRCRPTPRRWPRPGRG